jgi:serine/threonine protein kinase
VGGTSSLGSVSEVSPGDVIAGKFRVERVLGERGMGYVVAARHLQLGQMVALRFMRAEICTPNYKSRFLREARNTVRLKSKHVSHQTCCSQERACANDAVCSAWVKCVNACPVPRQDACIGGCGAAPSSITDVGTCSKLAPPAVPASIPGSCKWL